MIYRGIQCHERGDQMSHRRVGYKFHVSALSITSPRPGSTTPDHISHPHTYNPAAEQHTQEAPVPRTDSQSHTHSPSQHWQTPHGHHKSYPGHACTDHPAHVLYLGSAHNQSAGPGSSRTGHMASPAASRTYSSDGSDHCPRADQVLCGSATRCLRPRGACPSCVRRCGRRNRWMRNRRCSCWRGRGRSVVLCGWSG